MQKWGWKTAGFGIAAALTALWIVRVPIVSSCLSKTLGMRVSVATVGFSPSQMKMGHFRIDNPHQYKRRHALEAASIHSSYHWKDLVSNPLVVDQIVIDRIALFIELANAPGTRNNWTELISAIPERKKDAKEMIIRKLILTNVTVDISGTGLLAKSETRSIDRMEFANVSSKKGFPVRELISRIFGSANLMQYIKGIIPQGPGGIIKMLRIFGTVNEKGQENPGPSP